MICHSLFFDHDLDLQNNYSKENLIGDGNLKPENHLVPGKEGRLYSIHSIGMPIIWTPFFALSYKLVEAVPEEIITRFRMTKWTFLRLLIALSMLTLTSWLAVQMFIFVSKHVSIPIAFIATATCFLSVPLLPMGFLFFTEIPAAFLAFQSFKLMQQKSNLKYLLAGISAGYLPFLHVKYVLLSVVLFFLLFLRWRKAIGLAFVFVILLAALNYHTWDNFMPYAAYGRIVFGSRIWIVMVCTDISAGTSRMVRGI
jgi:hypothetical protein